jgi:WD40 repeat protein
MDGAIRLWTPTETADAQHWQLWCTVDTNETVRNSPDALNSSIACVIDGKDFMPAVERAVQERMSDDPNTDEVAMEHLVAIANKTPEICLAIHTGGMMTAWALDTATSAATQELRAFTIAHVKSRIFENLAGFRVSSAVPHVEVQSYFDKLDGKLHFLLHAFDGRIGLFTSDIADLLSPTTNEQRLLLQTIWAGHSASIKKMNRNFSGRAVVSRTESGQCVVWNHPQHRSEALKGGLTRRCVIPSSGDIRRVCVLRKGRFVIFLSTTSISLWDCRSEKAVCLGDRPFQVQGDPLCLIALPRPDVKDATTAYIATVTSESKGNVWEVVLPAYLEGDTTTTSPGIYEFCSFILSVSESLKYVLPVDPAGTDPVVSGFLDVFARDIAISYTRGGRVDFWTARVDINERKVDWLSTCHTETGMPDPALASGSMLKKAALVNSARSQLTIWDIGGSRLEFKEDYEQQNVIQDLDWTSTPDGQSILAVGFPYRVILLSQMRFDYLNRGPAWAQIREISIRELTPHPIGDSTWLGDGHLVIGTGNQMFVYDRRIGSSDLAKPDLRLPQRKDGTWDLFEAVQRFNGPLPVFHPQFLSQSVLCGKATLVRRILVALHKTLKYLVPGEEVDDYLGLNIQEFYTSNVSLHFSSPDYFSNFNDRKEKSNLLAGFASTISMVTNLIMKRMTFLLRQPHHQSTKALLKFVSLSYQGMSRFS